MLACLKYDIATQNVLDHRLNFLHELKYNIIDFDILSTTCVIVSHICDGISDMSYRFVSEFPKADYSCYELLVSNASRSVKN